MSRKYLQPSLIPMVLARMDDTAKIVNMIRKKRKNDYIDRCRLNMYLIKTTMIHLVLRVCFTLNAE